MFNGTDILAYFKILVVSEYFSNNDQNWIPRANNEDKLVADRLGLLDLFSSQA